MAIFPANWAVGATLGKIVRSPIFWGGAAMLAILGGTYWYIKDDKRDAVEEAENRGAQDANNQASEETRNLESAIQESTDKIIADNARRREQTAKDFERVRGRIEAAPQEERQAPVAPLIIDTLNELDRLRSDRDRDVNSAPVRDAEVPVG